MAVRQSGWHTLLILFNLQAAMVIEEVLLGMQDFDATTVEEARTLGQDEIRERIWEFLTYLLKRVILFVSFGPGVLGVLWLLGRIFRR